MAQTPGKHPSGARLDYSLSLEGLNDSLMVQKSILSSLEESNQTPATAEVIDKVKDEIRSLRQQKRILREQLQSQTSQRSSGHMLLSC
jgi:hypothetical protein